MNTKTNGVAPVTHGPSEIEGKPAPTSARCVALAAAATLDQFADFTRATPGDAYTRTSDRLRGGTIGKHLRHTIDHFRAAVIGAQANQPIDYDHRDRETPIEQDPKAALDAIAQLTETIRNYNASALNDAVRIEVMLSGAGDCAELRSTLARELAFAAHHAVHHAAMLKAIALEFGFQTPETFGVAPSTLNYEQTRS